MKLNAAVQKKRKIRQPSYPAYCKCKVPLQYYNQIIELPGIEFLSPTTLSDQMSIDLIISQFPNMWTKRPVLHLHEYHRYVCTARAVILQASQPLNHITSLNTTQSDPLRALRSRTANVR